MNWQMRRRLSLRDLAYALRKLREARTRQGVTYWLNRLLFWWREYRILSTLVMSNGNERWVMMS